MGYTTTFAGQVDLSRPLTFAEAKTIIDLSCMDSSDLKAITGYNEYFQWVPTETLDAIVWDGNEKFYEYEALLRWLCRWLAEQGIRANGRLLWRGEDHSDIGEIIVTENDVTMRPGGLKTKSSKPLTAKKLGEMAIAMLTSADGANKP